MNGDSKTNGSGAAEGEAGNPLVQGGARTPQGTMVIVLLYGAVTVALWGYMYYIMLKFDGFLGGF